MKAALFLIGVLLAQTFDAASVKRSAPANPNGSTFEFQSGGGLRVENSTLRGLIESAYDIRDFQVSGGPGWLTTDRYDVFARSQSGDATASRAEDMKATRLKLQAVLADRFRLLVHHEMRELQEYTLIADRAGAKIKADATSANSANERTGIQEQLGLKLDSIKGPVETIVVDRAERPSDN